MPISWSVPLVLLSVLVATIGSFTALAHAQRMRQGIGRAALWWMFIGAATLGMAIWSMHFIGMLAFHLPIPQTYDTSLTLLSVVPAIAASLIGFRVLKDERIGRLRLLISGAVMGIGIGVMHYTGMAALKMSPPIEHSPAIVLLSFAIAIAASWVALLLMYRGERIRLHPVLRSLAGAVIMGLAISGMHYTAMQGLAIQPGSVCLSSEWSVEHNALALLIAVTVLFWFGGGILASTFDQRIALQNAEMLAALEQAHAELQHRAEQQARDMTRSLRDSEERLKLTIDKALDAIITLDEAGMVVCWNAEAERIFGFAEGEAVGRDLAELIIPERYRQQHREGMRRYLQSGIARILGTRIEIMALRKRGEEFAIELSVIAVPHGDETLFSAFLRDISERKQSEHEIHQLAFYDPLTMLPNRRLLMDRLAQALAVSERTGQHGALLFLDLDNFKALNDTRGHDIGDLLLVEVARRLEAGIRDGDTVARLGGDEFVVVLEALNTDAAKAATQAGLVAEKVHTALSKPYLLGQYRHHSSPSIGVALFLGHQESIEDLLKHADVAMYQAKAAGRNAIRFFDPQMQAALDTRAALETDLRLALDQRQFHLHYQIQADGCGKAAGAEVLLRWEHPERGLVSPAEFIPLAEETGLIVPIGLWVLQTACTRLAAWQHGPLTRDLTIAVNVSARQLRQPDFVTEVQRILLETGARPSHLKLELTESTVLENVERAIARMRELKLLGLGFSMDDFGTGYSSLQYLKSLPLDQIKIDRSFVRDIASDPNDAAIVQAIIAMSEVLVLNVIAEGVEIKEQRDFLDRHGCHVFQGYLFGRPLPLEQFEVLLQQSSAQP